MAEFETTPGVNIHYELDDFTDPWRKSETVLFIHGASESSIAWYAWVPYFARHFRILRPDTRGFGQSTPMALDYKWDVDELVADFARLLDHLGIAKLHVVAAKSGGPIAIHLAATMPERVKTLTVCGSPVSGKDLTAQQRGGAEAERPGRSAAEWARLTMRGRLGSKLPDAAIDFWIRLMSSAPKTTQAGFRLLLPHIDVMPDLPRIACPTLIVIGSSAEVTDGVEHVRSWQTLIPDSSLMVVPNDGFHVAVAEADLVAPAALQFIRRNETIAA